jgi:hypothetical protein
MTEYLRETSYDRPIACGVVVQFKERCCHELVVAGNREERLLRQRHQEEPFVLLGAGAVSRHVGILGGLKIGPPPIRYNLLQKYIEPRGKGCK